MYYNIFYTFLLFIIYSFIGWIVDVCDVLVVDKKLVNRGFLIGPICPIYGVGVLLMIRLLTRFIDTPLALFILAIAIFMTLEYFTSYIMEKLFNAGWWDYSNYKYNLNGRICLETTIPFGIGGMIVMYIVNPFITSLLDKVGSNTIITIGIILLVIFVIDLIVSFSVITKIKNVFSSKYKDDTEEVNNRVKQYLIKLSPLTKRLMESFPNLGIKIKNIKNKIEKTVNKNIRKK